MDVVDLSAVEVAIAGDEHETALFRGIQIPRRADAGWPGATVAVGARGNGAEVVRAHEECAAQENVRISEEHAHGGLRAAGDARDVDPIRVDGMVLPYVRHLVEREGDAHRRITAVARSVRAGP